MITTKRQKIFMVLIGLTSMLLMVAVLVPYKTIFACANILTIEILFKVLVFPVLALALSIYPICLHYRQIKGYREQSKIVSVMSYFPIISYIIGLIINGLYMLTKGVAPLGQVSWCLWFIVLLASIILIACLFHIFTKYEMLLGLTEHMVLDICILIIAICFAVMNAQITKAYHQTMLAAGVKGDPYLLIIYIAVIVYIGFHIRSLANLIKDDEYNINVKMAELEVESHTSITAEYNRAYNDIISEFEDYFREEGDLDIIVEDEINEESETELEENPEEVVEEDEETISEGEDTLEVVDEEVLEEEISEEENQETEEESQEKEEDNQETEEETQETEEESQEKVIVEKVIVPVAEEEIAELESQKSVLEEKLQEKEKLEAEVAELIPEKPAIPKPVDTTPKNIQPSYTKLVNRALGAPGITAVENTDKTQTRFLVNRKMYLQLNDNPKDYRLTFYADMDKIVDWIIACPAIKARSLKDDNWFKLTNKGNVPEELLFDIIDSSLQAHIRDEELKKEERKKNRKAKSKAKQGPKE